MQSAPLAGFAVGAAAFDVAIEVARLQLGRAAKSVQLIAKYVPQEVNSIPSIQEALGTKLRPRGRWALVSLSRGCVTARPLLSYRRDDAPIDFRRIRSVSPVPSDDIGTAGIEIRFDYGGARLRLEVIAVVHGMPLRVSDNEAISLCETVNDALGIPSPAAESIATR
jgi:hypothetical protein